MSISPRVTSLGVSFPGSRSPRDVRPSGMRHRLQASGAQLVLAGLLLSGCTIGDVDQKVSTGAGSSVSSEANSTSSPKPGENVTQSHRPTTTATKEAGGQGGVPEEIDIATIQKRYGVQLAVAVAHPSGAWSSEWNGSNAAWSTIKVPLAIAALRNNPTDPTIHSWLEAAITSSDNDAALQLWNSLGGGDTAATAAEKVLAEGGVAKVEVPSQVTRPDFSAFGQTKLTPLQEATFAKNLPSIPGADPVLAAMGRIIPGQSYGLGVIDGARFKGGWGPGEASGFDSRQFGVVPTNCGDIGVALSSWNPNGDQATSQQALSELAEQVAAYSADTCHGVNAGLP